MKNKKELRNGHERKFFLSNAVKTGFSNAFSLGGISIKLPDDINLIEDSFGIMSDWEIVGNDIREAQERFKESELGRGIFF